MSALIDFGAPAKFGTHHFFVEIPPGPRDAVSIFEDFGFEGDVNQREKTEHRALVARELWTAIRDEARRDFNLRLKEKKHKPGTWNAGKTKLDRFLGKELCVLVWAAEHASPEECPILCQKWLALRPEERWWLYAKTAAEAAKCRSRPARVAKGPLLRALRRYRHHSAHQGQAQGPRKRQIHRRPRRQQPLRLHRKR